MKFGIGGCGVGSPVGFDFDGISAAALDKLEGVTKKFGVVQKRGSGVGMFASTKWKKKLLCVLGGSCVYFDGTEISEKNCASRYLPLAGAFVEVLDSESGKKGPAGASHAFKVIAPARSFTFGCSSKEELDGWLAAFNAEITTASSAARGADEREQRPADPSKADADADTGAGADSTAPPPNADE